VRVGVVVVFAIRRRHTREVGDGSADVCSSDLGLSLTAGLAAAPAHAVVVEKPLRQAVKSLPVAREVRASYDRDRFRLWVDADSDGCDTRDEVLLSESTRPVRLSSGCTWRAGRWTSYYDGRATADPSTFDIDHLVPLAEAWDSGARRWNAGTRQRFANDLGDRRSLVAVTASSNRSKSDQDPAEWLPHKAVQCRYVREWVAVKTRWRLTVNLAEKRVLTRLAADCSNRPVVVSAAKVVLRGAEPSPAPTGGGMDPRYATCTEAKAHGYGPYVKGRDSEYAWYEDRDGDGRVCE